MGSGRDCHGGQIAPRESKQAFNPIEPPPVRTMLSCSGAVPLLQRRRCQPCTRQLAGAQAVPVRKVREQGPLLTLHHGAQPSPAHQRASGSGEGNSLGWGSKQQHVKRGRWFVRDNFKGGTSRTRGPALSTHLRSGSFRWPAPPVSLDGSFSTLGWTRLVSLSLSPTPDDLSRRHAHAHPHTHVRVGGRTVA